MSIGKDLRPHPARDYAEASAAFDVLSARDGPEIAATGRSRFFSRGRRAPRAVVLLHGLTNAPEQWVPFAEQLHAGGDAVILPRFPGHGFADRKTRAIAAVGSNDLLAVASEALDIACGAGERVTLAGLSIGGAVALWLAFTRGDVARALAIVPFIGIAKLNEPLNRVATRALAALPNVFVPWDPGGDGSQIPPYAYAAFPTHLLAACLAVGLEALNFARLRAPAGRLDLALNAREPACNNALSRALATAAAGHRAGSAVTTIWSDLPAVHDIVDPTNPQARTDLVYPRLRALIDAG